MANFYYVTEQELTDAVKDIKEDRLSAVVLFMEYFPKGKSTSMSENAFRSSELFKALNKSLGNRVTCPIYINYLNPSKMNDDYLESIPVYAEYGITLKATPTIVLFKNGEMTDLTHNPRDIQHNGFKGLINYIKSL